MTSAQFGGVLFDIVGVYLMTLGVFALLFQLLLSFSVYNDAKARNILNPRLFLGITMCGGAAAAIAYAVIRNKQQRAEVKDAALAKKAKTQLVWACICFGLMILSIFAYVAAIAVTAVAASM